MTTEEAIQRAAIRIDKMYTYDPRAPVTHEDVRAKNADIIREELSKVRAETHLPGCKRQDRHEPCQVECDPEPSPDLKAVCVTVAREWIGGSEPLLDEEAAESLANAQQSLAAAIQRHLSPYLAQREAAFATMLAELQSQYEAKIAEITGVLNATLKQEAADKATTRNLRDENAQLREALESARQNIEGFLSDLSDSDWRKDYYKHVVERLAYIPICLTIQHRPGPREEGGRMSLSWYHYLTQPEELVYLIRHRKKWWLPTCPCCKGKGSLIEIIDSEIGGPSYDCGYCEAREVISWWAWLRWLWWTREFFFSLGAGLAYAPGRFQTDEWNCSTVLLEKAAPIMCYTAFPWPDNKVKTECQPSAAGRTTRP